MTASLLLFTKPAIPGRVKTRLAATVGEERAATIHRAFAGDVIERLRAGRHFELQVSWALADGEEPPTWPEAEGLRWSRQHPGDLGDRLYAALHRACRAGGAAAAVGSDHPEVDPELVERAFSWLESGADLVLGPASDGGYYLIAVAAHALGERLFQDIDWSTERVRQQTLERAAELGLRVRELPMGHDIDREPDLRALAIRLQGDPELCPRTRRTLAAWGWLQGDSASEVSVGEGEVPCGS
ncbi:MAG: TIGR04282 family arsenosugar biosynthesis glycosyltransferase [Acidobacteriota bacterium]